ncbi:MAG: hypothetical protein Q4D12_08435 [Bacteroidales bacterium]|nr:hypothetical protein [Bacteroidales bacterium]
MLKVWRYPINDVSGVNNISMPEGAQITGVGVATHAIGEEGISVWALVDTEAPLETRTFVVAGTDVDMTDTLTRYNYKILGTVHLTNLYAFHVFEIIA